MSSLKFGLDGCPGSSKTLIAPLATGILAFTVISRGKAVELAFFQLDFADDFVSRQAAKLNLMLFDNGVNFFVCHDTPFSISDAFWESMVMRQHG